LKADTEAGIAAGVTMTATAVDRSPVIVEEASSATTKQVFAQFPTGVVAVCAVLGGTNAGFAASSFQTVSWDPALVSICVQNNSNTWNALRSSDRIGISVLSEDHGSLAFQLSSRHRDRFDGVETHASARHALFIGGAAAWMECSVHQEIPAGDHTLVIFEVHSLGTAEQAPMVYHRQSIGRIVVS
jgi:flavin reductase (DIM6/NTAB) family NADH-FMN oxidoreductase RutF